MTSVATQRVSPAPQALPEPGVYRHFKGGEYELLYVACHSETEELLAVYCSLNDPTTTWVRPLEMFTELVEHAGSEQPRFMYVSGPSKLNDRLGRMAKPLMRVRRHFTRGSASTGRPVGTRIPS
jgi:hypothetical protein